MSKRLFLALGALVCSACSDPEADTGADNSTLGTGSTSGPGNTLGPGNSSIPSPNNAPSPGGTATGVSPTSSASGAISSTSGMPSSTSSTTSGAGGAAPGTGGTTSGTGGATPGTGGTTSGMGSAISGAGGVSGAGGGTTSGAAGDFGSDVGGASAGGTGGVPSPAGGAGSGGTAGGGSTDLTSIAADFHQLRLECPCVDPDHFGPDKQDNCDSLPEVDRQTHVRTLGGDPDVTYNVTLHVRGNTEPNTYVDGTLEQERFYTGGRTSTPGYTAYMLTVDEPSQVYFFNYNPTTGHLHFLLDYEVVIPMRGGTSLSFEVNGGSSVPDGHGVSNREELVVPGIPPAPDPFNGQLVQFDVVAVEPQADIR